MTKAWTKIRKTMDSSVLAAGSASIRCCTCSNQLDLGEAVFVIGFWGKKGKNQTCLILSFCLEIG